MDMNVATINSSINNKPNNVFRLWLEFTRPFHKMQNKSIDLLSFILVKRYNLMNILKDEKIVASILFNSESKNEICKELCINRLMLNTLLYNMRKSGVLDKDNNINPRYIPNISEDSNQFQILIKININE